MGSCCGSLCWVSDPQTRFGYVAFLGVLFKMSTQRSTAAGRRESRALSIDATPTDQAPSGVRVYCICSIVPYHVQALAASFCSWAQALCHAMLCHAMPCHAMADEPAGPHALPARACNCNQVLQVVDNRRDEMTKVSRFKVWRGGKNRRDGGRCMHLAGRAGPEGLMSKALRNVACKVARDSSKRVRPTTGQTWRKM